MKVFRKTIAGIGMTAAVTAALLAVTPTANAATNKKVEVFVHSYTRGVAIEWSTCLERNGKIVCIGDRECHELPGRNKAQWVPLSSTLASGSTVRASAFSDVACQSNATQISPKLNVPNDNSSEFRIDLNK